jgi:hypothetical protein
METEQQKEVVVHPDPAIVLAVSGDVRELVCFEIAAYWYTVLALHESL